MPIYRYLCDACGYEFEDLAMMDSVSERPCEAPAIAEEEICYGTAKRIPSIPAPAKFNCAMPTAATKHHKHGKP